MASIGETRAKSKQAESEKIARKTAEFLRKGGKIDQADLRETKQVDLTWRHYPAAAMEDADHEA